MTLKRIALVSVLAVLGVAGVWASQDAPKKAYLVANIDVMNPQQYGEYMKVTPGLLEKFGARFIARGGRLETLEGPPVNNRVILIEFPSFERAQQFYNSPEYVAARKLRAGAATVQFILLEGI